MDSLDKVPEPTYSISASAIKFEETVFDVNVLVLDEHHVCVNNMNPIVIDFLKKHNMEPVHVPWRHRFFWDGGLHCITLDLYREGRQHDYFPSRQNTILDCGFE